MSAASGRAPDIDFSPRTEDSSGSLPCLPELAAAPPLHVVLGGRDTTASLLLKDSAHHPMRDGPVLHLFGGKGGAGKSTLASAFALTLTDALPRRQSSSAAAEPTKALSDVWKRLCRQAHQARAGQGRGRPVRRRSSSSTRSRPVPRPSALRWPPAAAKGLLLGRRGPREAGVRCGPRASKPALRAPGSRGRARARERWTGSWWTWPAPAPPCVCSTPRTALRRARRAWCAARSPAGRRRTPPRRATPRSTRLVAELERFWALVKDPHADRVPPRGPGRAGGRGAGQGASSPASVSAGIPVAEIVVNAVEEQGRLARLRRAGAGSRRPTFASSRPSTRPSRCSSSAGGRRPRAAWRRCSPFAKEMAGGQGDQGAASSAPPRGLRRWCARRRCLPSPRRRCRPPG